MSAAEVTVFALLALHGGMLATLGVNLAYLRRSRSWKGLDGVPTKAWPTVSVLVPARNEAQNLRCLLPSLAVQTYPRLEVIVVDDASEDATGAVLEAHRARFDEAGHVLRPMAGTGPPAGWLGKPHALYQATREATGDVFVFLDADATLQHPDALRTLVGRFVAAERAPGAPASEDRAVFMSGLPRYRDTGGAALLTSLVPFSILSALPLPLVPRTRAPSIGALNGQCWAIRAEAYRQHEPHVHHRGEILEDVQIGRTLKRRGLRLFFVDLSDVLAVRMYANLGDAWRGFRKNAYLLAGGRPSTFVPLWLFYGLTFTVAPWLSLWLLGSVVLLKGACDVSQRLPWWLPLAAPLVFALASVLQLDSAVSHWTGRVAWKGRSVA